MEDHLGEVVGNLLHLVAMARPHARHRLRLHRHDDHALVQHLVVLEVVHEGGGRGVGVVGQEDGGAGDALGLGLPQHADEVHRLDGVALRLAYQQGVAAHPGRHHRDGTGGDQQRHVAAVHHLDQVGGEKGEVDRQEQADEGQRRGQRPAPQPPHHHEGDGGGHHHGAGDGDAVGGGERARRLEQQHQRQHADEQQAVDAGDEDLALLRFGGVLDQHAR